MFRILLLLPQSDAFKIILLFLFRPVCPGLSDSPWKSPVQPVCGSHLLPHGLSEVCCQKTRIGSAGKRLGCTIALVLTWSIHLIYKMVLSGLLLPLEILGAAWPVPGEHVQSRQSTTPTGPHAFGHTLLPDSTCTACTETGGMFDAHTPHMEIRTAGELADLSDREYQKIRWTWGGRSPSICLSYTRPVGTWRWPGSSSTHTALFESMHEFTIMTLKPGLSVYWVYMYVIRIFKCYLFIYVYSVLWPRL